MSTVVAEISERAACAAWSPLLSHPDIVALGTKVRHIELSFPALMWSRVTFR